MSKPTRLALTERAMVAALQRGSLAPNAASCWLEREVSMLSGRVRSVYGREKIETNSAATPRPRNRSGGGLLRT